MDQGDSMRDFGESTPAAVAAWMWETIRAEAELDYRRTADRVAERFGPAFLESNRFGRPTVREDVRELFTSLHGGTVVRGGGRWYLRDRTADEARRARRALASRPAW
jgi:hypothetical protein